MFAIRIGSIVVAALMICSFISSGCVSASADSVRVENTYSAASAQVNAESTANKPRTINVTKTRKITDDMVVEQGQTMYVRSGGILYIDTGATLTLNGKLKVAEGGSVYIRGKLDMQEGSLFSCTGKTKILSSGSIQLGGELWVNPTGEIKGAGSINVLNAFDDIRCKGRVTAKIKAPEPVEIDGVTYVGGILLVNKEFSLPKDYGDGLDSEAYTAYIRMKRASGYDMRIVSGFRSYTKQESTFSYWCSVDGEELASTYSARPGHSEHQTGLAMDITSLKQSYGKTEEGKWLAQNCVDYGFIIRYPKGKTDITGYMYEPWHIRYLGKSTAKLVKDSGLTLEEFLGVA